MDITKAYENGTRYSFRVFYKGVRKTVAVDKGDQDERQGKARALLAARTLIHQELKRRRELDLSQTKPRDYATILDCLYDRRVASFSLTQSKYGLDVGECCDYYFSERLDKSQAQQLVNELQSLVDEMEG